MTNTQTSPVKILLLFSYPIFITQICSVLRGLIGTVYLGKINLLLLSSLSISDSLYQVIIFLCMGCCSASTIFSSQANKNSNELYCAEFVGFLNSIFFSFFSIFLIFLIQKNLNLFHFNSEIYNYIDRYISGSYLGLIPFIIATHFRYHLIGIKRLHVLSFYSLIGLISFVILTHIFIHNVFAKDPMYGFALAQSISYWIVLLCMLIGDFKNSFLYSAFKMSDFHPILKSIKIYLKLGVPLGLVFAIEIGVYLFIGYIIKYIDVESMALFQIIAKINSFFLVLPFAFSQAILVHENHSTKEFSKKLIKLSSFIWLGIFALILLGYAFFSTRILNFFGINEIPSSAKSALILSSFFLLFSGLTSILTGLFRAQRKTFFLTVIWIVSFWFIGVPLCLLFAFTLQFHFIGIWIGLTVASLFLYLFCIRKLKGFR